MSILSVIPRFCSQISRRKLLLYASSGCYYLFMSLVPITMLLCCLLQYTPITESMVLGLIDQYVTASLADILKRIVLTVYSSGAGTVTVSLLLTLYSASSAMKALMKGMDAAYNYDRQEGFLRYTLHAIEYMVILLLAVILALVVLVYSGRLVLLADRYLPSLRGLASLVSKLRILLGIPLLTLAFTLLYTVIPAKKIRPKDQLPGAIFTAVIWVLFSSLFSLYLSVSNRYGAYGMIGTVMVSMMWMFYCSVVMLIGGLLNSFLVYANRRSTGWRFDFPEELFDPRPRK